MFGGVTENKNPQTNAVQTRSWWFQGKVCNPVGLITNMLWINAMEFFVGFVE